MKRVACLLALLAPIALAACNTMEGMGRDMQSGGERLEDSANRAKNGQ